MRMEVGGLVDGGSTVTQQSANLILLARRQGNILHLHVSPSHRRSFLLKLQNSQLVYRKNMFDELISFIISCSSRRVFLHIRSAS